MGIGEAIANAVAHEGANLILVSRSGVSWLANHLKHSQLTCNVIG
jgi:short-subunit dehydrogenase